MPRARPVRTQNVHPSAAPRYLPIAAVFYHVTPVIIARAAMALLIPIRLVSCPNFICEFHLLVQRRFSSSKRWQARQSNDHFTREAAVQGLKSRAAFKLLQIDEKYRIFESGQTVVDLVRPARDTNGKQIIGSLTRDSSNNIGICSRIMVSSRINENPAQRQSSWCRHNPESATKRGVYDTRQLLRFRSTDICPRLRA
ncbi:hypothetical protein BJX61DRAFT_237850 [Aspergillus egyptiacus]|nr:hypothetical protein BJX61DRAFT_237850 [Aspergillus egyptiacus]